MKIKSFVILLLLSLPFLFGAIYYGKTDQVIANLQPESLWSKPQTIFEDPDGYIANVDLFSDDAGSVHLFWSHNNNSNQSELLNQNDTYIYYTSKKNGSTGNFIDILNNHNATLRFSHVLDHTGVLYLVTKSGDTPCLNFISLGIQDLSFVKKWDNLRCLEEQGLATPAITINHNDVLYVIFIRQGQRNLAIIKSEDKGVSWSLPYDFYSVSVDAFLSEPVAQTDQSGVIHLTWTEMSAPSGYPPKRIMYTNSNDEGMSWSTPFELAGMDQGQQNMAVDKNNIYVIWNGTAGLTGRYFRLSTDGGKTWLGRMDLPTDHSSGGLQGRPAIVVDNTGTVHTLYANDYFLNYNTFKNGMWGAPENIAGIGVSKAKTEIDNPFLTISEGNILHAFYCRDYIAADYQTKMIQAKHEPPLPYIQSTAENITPTTNQIEIKTTDQSSVDVEKIKNLPAGKSSTNSQSTILLISFISVTGLILIILVMREKKRR